VFEMNITPLKETTREKVERVFQEYKLVLETQMHFNDMLMKYRSLAFTVIPALGGLAVFILEKITNIGIAFGFALLLFAVWIGVFLVDFCYYFRMLLGAVKRSEELEEEIKEMGFSPSFLGLTGHINKTMPAWAAKLVVLLFYLVPFLVGIGVLVYFRCIA